MAVLEKPVPEVRWTRNPVPNSEPLKGAFFWLSAFYLVYCARPEDWIPVLKYAHLAKITGICALVALVSSAGRSKRNLRNLPREVTYLFAIICLLVVSALLSPVWKGGALFKTLDFAKVLVAWVLTYAVITNFQRLRRIIFIQSVSVVAITMVSILKVRSHPRLDGAVGGIYSNPNDLAFAIVLSLPFCFAFLLRTRSAARKAAWLAAMLVMLTALFLTASRAGFIDLLVTGVVCLWFFGVKGKRIHLIAGVAVVALVVGGAAGGRLKERFFAISGENLGSGFEQSAYGSFEQRRELMVLSIHTIARYPWGIGMEMFGNYSGVWREVHVAYLQIAVEGGVASLICYLLFFARGFANLRQVRRMRHDQERELFIFALHGSLVGFVVGALFAPEAYQFFPYFAVAYTSVLLAMAKEEREDHLALEPSNSDEPNLARDSANGRNNVNFDRRVSTRLGQ